MTDHVRRATRLEGVATGDKHCWPATIAEALTLAGQRHLDRPFLRTEQDTWSFAQVANETQQVASVLRRLGLRGGDHVALAGKNSAQWMIGFFALSEIGAVVIPIHVDAVEEELVTIFDDAGVRSVLVDTELSAVRRAADRVGCSVVRVRLGADSSQHAGATVSGTGEGSDPDDAAVLLYTSSIERRPHVVIHSQRSLLSSAQSWHFHTSSVPNDMPQLQTDGRGMLMLFPFSSIAGFQFLLLATIVGQPLVTLARFHPRSAMRLIERARPGTMVAGVVHTSLMMRLRDFAEFDHSSLREVSLTGDYASSDVIADVERRFGCRVRNAFGMTELGGGVMYLGEPQPDLAVGRAAEIEIRVRDERDCEVAFGEPGEVMVRSPGHAIGHRIAGEIVPVADDEGWVATGDLGVRDPFGGISIVGRKKGTIIRAGRNVDPEEVVAVLIDHPEVQTALVYGSGSLGCQRVEARVVRAATAGPDLVERLLAHCGRRLSAHKVPAHVSIVEDLDGSTP